MKNGAFILCLTILLVQFRQSMVQLDYVINRDYISKMLCIDKDLEVSNCEGQCHLKKELEKVEKGTDEPVKTTLRFVTEEISFFADDIARTLKAEYSKTKSNYCRENENRIFSGFYFIFIPPPEMI